METSGIDWNWNRTVQTGNRDDEIGNGIVQNGLGLEQKCTDEAKIRNVLSRSSYV